MFAQLWKTFLEIICLLVTLDDIEFEINGYWQKISIVHESPKIWYIRKYCILLQYLKRDRLTPSAK